MWVCAGARVSVIASLHTHVPIRNAAHFWGVLLHALFWELRFLTPPFLEAHLWVYFRANVDVVQLSLHVSTCAVWMAPVCSIM